MQVLPAAQVPDPVHPIPPHCPNFGIVPLVGVGVGAVVTVEIVVGIAPPVTPLITEIKTGLSLVEINVSPAAFGCTPSRSILAVKPVLQSAMKIGEAVVF
jgi:hypothetical protein